MKLISYEVNGKTQVGILDGDNIQQLDTDQSLLDLITSGDIPASSNTTHALVDVKILPPIMPGKILAIGRNYVEHARELNNEVPSQPLVFAIMPSAIIGDGDVIEWEQDLTGQVDWEGELAVIIGKTARKVSEADALDYVFGYTVANDVSARDLQSNDKQWVRAKGLDTFCPIGPCVVTVDDIPDPQSLTIITTVDDVEKQNGSTANMIFKVAFLIEYLSRAFTLNPGDMILTGTPSGVGKGMNPPQFLTTGNRVSVEIAEIGKLTNSCKIIDA